MRMRPLLGASLTVAVFAAGTGDAARIDFSDFYVFGDSLSDVGRAFALSGGTVPPTPPYYQGQFTGPHGPVWAEIVGDAFAAEGKEVANYAVGGAAALGAGAADLTAQIAEFSADVASGDANPGSEPLAAFWAGANDIFATLDTTVATAAADAVTTAASSLSGLGIDSSLFFTFSDFSLLPAFRGSPFAALAESAGRAFDARLRSNVAALRGLGLDARIVETGALFKEAQLDPAAFGFTNIADACVLREGAVILSDCTGRPGVDVMGYLWWDSVHPGSRAHGAIADAALAEIAVPLPASASFALAGIACLLVVGRRNPEPRR